jgi:hypothetical protein
MNGPLVMCNGCAAVEVPLAQPFCSSCSDMVMEQLSVPMPTMPATQEQPPKLIVIGPFDV